MVKEGKKDMKDEEDVAKAKNTFSKIYDYVFHKTYSSHADKLYGLRKHSKFFTADRGHLYYIGGKGNEKPCLVVKSAEERRRMIHRSLRTDWLSNAGDQCPHCPTAIWKL